MPPFRVALAPVLLVLLVACTARDPVRGPGLVTATPGAPATSTVVATPTATATPSQTPPPGPRVVTIGLVGDLMFARDVVTLMEEHGAGYPFERVTPLFRGVDVLIGNLEGTFTDRGLQANKYYTFRAPPALASTLLRAGFDAVSLGNNHALDFGPVGLADTLAALDALGIAHFGAGEDTAAAVRPLMLDAGGFRLALLGFSAVRSSVFAGTSQPGVAEADYEEVVGAVQAATTEADFVVVVFHFGREYDPMPTDEQRLLARAAADAGATLVVGHHAHTLQPWERRGDSLILYGLGNFVFDLDPNDLATLGEGPFATVVAVVELHEGASPSVEFRPAYIDPYENRPRPATDDEAERIRDALRELVGE